MMIITAVTQLKKYGIFNDDDTETRERVIANGMRMDAANIAVNGSGLKLKY